VSTVETKPSESSELRISQAKWAGNPPFGQALKWGLGRGSFRRGRGAGDLCENPSKSKLSNSIARARFPVRGWAAATGLLDTGSQGLVAAAAEGSAEVAEPGVG